jgi:probable F420-dependent oxidoreductase
MRDRIPPRLIVGLSNFHDFLPNGEWHRLLDVAEAADAAGVDGISVVDHVVLGGDLDGYPYGAFPGGLDAPWLEPLTTLAAFVGRTEGARLMTGVLVAPLRPAALLAKTVATLDQLSGGRLELGVGTGWLAEEYGALGLDYADRGRLLDSTLDACRDLWSPGATNFHSDFVHLEAVHSSPPPLQAGVPIWVGGDLHPRNVRRIVERADGWIPSPPARPAEIAAGAEKLRTAFEEAGRDPTALRVRVSVVPRRTEDSDADVGSTFRDLAGILEATGATDVFVPHAAFRPRHGGDDEELFGALVEMFNSAVTRS